MNVSLLLLAISIVAPKDGVTVSLLKDAQRGFVSAPAAERQTLMADREARASLAKCGGRPAGVVFEWTDDQSTPDAVYAIEVKRSGSDQVENFEVKGALRAELVNLESGRAYAWKVRRLGGESSQAAAFRTADEPRLMFFPGVVNCRDLGGSKGLGGRRLRQGRVYRTGAYNGSSRRAGDSFLDARFVPGEVRVTPSGRREMVGNCGIRTDLDLRSEQECAGMSASPLGTNVVWAHVPLRAYGWLENDKPALAGALRRFADDANYPIAIHCSGGRDRAGSLAFLLKGLAGVGEDELIMDWECSVFDTDSLDFSYARIKGLLQMLARYPGIGVNAQIESFVRSCGLTDDEIARIRANLLEEQ